jgi:D-alanyl-D-alanine carboxypeptidase
LIKGKKNCLKFLFFLALTGSIRAQSFDPNLAASLQRALDSIRVTASIKGISAGVYYPGYGSWRGSSGESHTSVAVSSDMEFGIGSNTKLFTSVALLKLFENNVITLNDSIRRWLPSITNVHPAITIRQLLNHTSGVADYTDYPGYADSILSNPNRLFSPEELLPWIGTPLFQTEVIQIRITCWRE